jgi:hypothetical protein
MGISASSCARKGKVAQGTQTFLLVINTFSRRSQDQLLLLVGDRNALDIACETCVICTRKPIQR